MLSINFFNGKDQFFFGLYSDVLFFLALHFRAAAAAAVMMGDEFYSFGWCRPERNDFVGMTSAERPNSPSRQIYLTFPAESTFKDEDVSEYFR